jgi:DNA polymerase III epsilon subunit-like protein
MSDFIVFDTETTGLPPKAFKNVTKENLDQWPHIVQISWVRYETSTNKLLKTSDYIIKLPAGVIITDENYSFHGISNKISESRGKDVNVVLREFLEDCKNVDVLVGHNINFDYNMLKALMMRNESCYTPEDIKLLASRRKYCTARETFGYCNIQTVNSAGEKYIKYPTLAELYEKLFNEKPKNLHNSMNDVLITLRCLLKFKFNKDVNNEVKSVIRNLLS